VDGEEPNNPDYSSDYEYDVTSQTMDYDPSELPFAGEDYVDTLFPKTDEYEEKLTKFEGKEPRSIKILNKEEDKGDKERNKAIKDTINAKPPSYSYIENIPYINYSEGILSFMWDKNKGKPNYDQKNDNSWLSPYIIKK
jgi:hypothetical protein